MKKIFVLLFVFHITVLRGQIAPDSLVVDTIHLQEITIENTVKYIENKFDRKVVNISTTQKAAARSILDILRTLPGVVVDEAGNIRYKGTDAILYVDDQDIKYVFGKVEMIPVERVDKIELIDLALYTGGSGRGGIINIKLKPIRNDGLSGMASAKLNTVNFSELNNSREFGNLNYKNDKFTFFINSSLESTNQNTLTKQENDFKLLGLSDLQSITEESFWKRTANYNYLGCFYDPSPDTKFYTSFSYHTATYDNNKNKAFSAINNNNQVKTTEYNNENKAKNKQLLTGGYISYFHKIDTIGTQIKLSASFTIYNSLNNDNSVYNYRIVNAETSDSIYQYLNIRNIYSKDLYLNAFYNYSISEKTRWNLSYYVALDWIDPLIFHQFIFDRQNLPLEQKSENINLRHNLSLRFGTEWKKWKFDAGLNFSGAQNNGQFVRYDLAGQDTVLRIDKKYFRILPSATMAYALNKNREIKLSLAKTVEFPYFLQLCDYIDKNTLYQWKSGTSTLNPVDYYSMYLAYSLNEDKWNASAELFYNYTNNDIKNVSIPVNSLVFLSKPENIAKTSNTGIDLSSWFQLTKKLNFTLSSSIYHTFFDISSLNKTAQQQNVILPELTRRQLGYNLKSSVNYSIKSIYTMFYINYYSKELTFNGYQKAYINSTLNISKKFLNDKLIAALSIDNIFSNFVKRGEYSDEFGVISNTSLRGTPYQYSFGISLQYNFNKGDRGTKDLR